MFAEKISYEEILELPLRQFDGDIIMVETPKMARTASLYLRDYSIIGFDTETRPSCPTRICSLDFAPGGSPWR